VWKFVPKVNGTPPVAVVDGQPAGGVVEVVVQMGLT
jgi:hypothetical protein